MIFQRSRRSRRVQLAVPGSSEKMMSKAAGSKADHVFLDLEDAVAPKEKVASRRKIIDALKSLDWTGKTRCVRINDLTTQWAYEDIISVVEEAHEHLDTIMLPKARSASDVLFVDTLLSQIEKKLKIERRIGIEVLIEEVEGMLNVEEIAFSTPRLEALIFGMGDYSASQGIDPKVIAGKSGYPGDAWHYGRWKIAVAARAAKIDAIDGPFPDFRDAETYSEECRRGLLLGFVGKWAIHPAQIEPALSVFTPDPAAVAKARRMVEVYAQAEKDGLGAIAMDGEMVDAATVRMVQDILQRADSAGL
ncbi:HpcH/HpaI aldolase/citrate lyase family protein [Microvirga zambiensis]|uniref:HpcH/HpaI aldolase/citrate lyase family protein n=1 Tax=Microvirga zambiensis TaxID=1402137 RepID=UPI00191D0233|nr:CoA ester lyase [Microvirga zambiensis]